MNNLDILDEYSLKTKYIPDKLHAIDIFNKMKNMVKENDIISINNYRGNGQYYIHNIDGKLFCSPYCGDYGEYYPACSAKYFLKNELHNLQHVYIKYNVFAEMHRKKIDPEINNNMDFNIYFHGVCIDTEKYYVSSLTNNCDLKNTKYLLLNFCFDENDIDIDNVILIDKEDNEKYTLKCIHFDL